jgi:urease accessory protein
MSTPIRIEAERRGGRTVAAVLAGSELVRPRVLAGPGLRIALVQTAACLLAGDDLALEVSVGPGAALELIEPAATIAHHGRSGPAASWSADVRVAGSLRWTAAPFVVAAGADVTRTLRVDVAAGGVALLRDLLVFGRAGEEPGALRSETELRHAGRPLLVEALDTRDPAFRSPAVVGDAKVLDTIALVGTVPLPFPDTWELPGEGALRSLPAVTAAAADAAAGPLLRAWGALLTDGLREVGDEVLGSLDPA